MERRLRGVAALTHADAAYIARTEDQIVEELGDELLIYDERTDVAHCLTDVAAVVWRACAQGASLAELTQQVVGRDAGTDAAAIAAVAVEELRDKNLIEVRGLEGRGITRQQALRR